MIKKVANAIMKGIEEWLFLIGNWFNNLAREMEKERLSKEAKQNV